MTVAEALAQCDALKPNEFPQQLKREWLSDVELHLQHEVYDTHLPAHTTQAPFARADDGVQLSAPAPYAVLYVRYLHAQIDLYNGEFERYNNTAALFNSAYQNYVQAYHRTHTPLQKHCAEVH